MEADKPLVWFPLGRGHEQVDLGKGIPHWGSTHAVETDPQGRRYLRRKRFTAF